MEIDKVFNNGIDGVADNLFSAVNNSVSEIKAMQQRKAAENVQLVIQALKKIDSDIRSRYDEVGNAIEKRVATIKDGRDGINGKDGKNGKDGRDGKQGVQGTKGQDGINGRDGVDGVDGVSVTSAHIDFDGSLIIGLSSGVELNVGEVIAPSLAESIKVITNGGGTSQSVIDTLASLQTQITALIPSQTGNSGKFLTTNGTTTSWSSTPTFTSITDSGNLTFTGTGNRITGDMTTTTFTNRVAFQTTQVNGATSISAIPNGTSTASNINCYNNSDPTNASLLLAGTNATEALINSTIRGTGTYLPMTFYTSGSERARIDTSGNVGIGTSSPQAKLSVSNAGASGFEFFATYPGGGTGTYIQSYNRSGAAYVNTAYYALSHTFWANGSDRMVIDSSGNVGIGTSSPQSFAKQTIQFDGGGTISQALTAIAYGGSPTISFRQAAGTAASPAASNTTIINFIGASTSDGTTFFNTVAIQGGMESTASAGSHPTLITFATTPSGSTSRSERMRITSAGNVGIGTSSPAYKLDVAGAISTNNNLTFTGTGNRITGDFSNATVANRVAFQNSTTNAGSNLNLLPNGTALGAFWNAFGNSDPTNAPFGQFGITGGNEVRISSTITGTGTYAPMTFFTGGSERVRITTTGGVGIGTATPTSVSNYGSLAVNGSSGAFIDAYVNGIRTGSLEADASNVYVQSTSSVPLLFRTNSTERMRIDTSGNVGIGTSSPNASAILDAQSTTKGVRFPNMTTTQKNAISSPAAGLVVFDTTLSKLAVYSGTAWETITSV